MGKVTNPPPAAPRGRPRSESAKRAVLKATRALVQEGGYAAATIESIAARSGVAKTTIYRWWPNRPTLVVDLLVQLAAKEVPLPEGRDPWRSLRNEVRQVARSEENLVGQLLTSILGEAQRDPAVRAALVQGLFHPRTGTSARAIRRAQDAGTVRKDVSPELAVDLVFGPMFYRMFVGHAPLNDKFIEQVFHYVLTGLRSPENARKSTRAKRPAKRQTIKGRSRLPDSPRGR